MTSRDRLLAALDLEDTETTPCSFMLFKGLWKQSADYLDFIQRQEALGLDPYVQIPMRQPGLTNDHYNLHGLPVSYDPAVQVEEWVERPADGNTPLLFKEYRSPGGVLRAEVALTDDWPYGNHVPFLDDYLVPRSRKFLVESMADLDALGYLLVEPTRVETIVFREESQPVIDYAKQQGLLLAGGWGVGADLIGWVYGLQNMLYAVYDDPELVKGMLEMIGDWNRGRMRVVLDAGIDIYIKRAWYENCDFWTPSTFEEFITPQLKQDIDLAHEHGTRFGYLITSNVMPLLDQFAELGIDVLIGVDPQGWDLEMAKGKLGGKVCLWGGVNGHLTVEGDSPEQVRTEVRTAFEVLAPGGGFILSPVDNVREYTPVIQGNVLALVDEWKKLAG